MLCIVRRNVNVCLNENNEASVQEITLFRGWSLIVSASKVLLHCLCRCFRHITALSITLPSEIFTLSELFLEIFKEMFTRSKRTVTMNEVEKYININIKYNANSNSCLYWIKPTTENMMIFTWTDQQFQIFLSDKSYGRQ